MAESRRNAVRAGRPSRAGGSGVDRADDGVGAGGDAQRDNGGGEAPRPSPRGDGQNGHGSLLPTVGVHLVDTPEIQVPSNSQLDPGNMNMMFSYL